jgi:hypothetical protein
MPAARFNPLTYANSLEAAGFNRAQAEALAQGFLDLRFDMQDIEASLRKEIVDFKIEMHKEWMIGLWILQTGTLVTILKYFF